MHVDIRLNGRKSKIHYKLGNQPLEKKRGLFNPLSLETLVEYAGRIVVSGTPRGTPRGAYTIPAIDFYGRSFLQTEYREYTAADFSGGVNPNITLDTTSHH